MVHRLQTRDFTRLHLAMDLLLTVVVLTIVLALVYWYGVKDYALIANVNVNGPKPWPYLGNLPDVFKYGGMHKAFWEYFKRYGRVHKFCLGRRPGIVVSDPEIVKNILVKDFDKFRNRVQFIKFNPPMVHSIFTSKDAKWKRIRTILTPTFSAAKLKEIVPLIEASLVELDKIMQRFVDTGENVDISRMFSMFALDVIMKAAFGYDADIQNHPNDEYLQRARNAIAIPLYKRAFTMFPFSDKIAETFNIQLLEGAEYFLSVVGKIVQSRKENGSGGRRDLLQMMLEAHDVEVDGSPKLSDDEMAAQSVGFLIAGFETSATTLSSIAYMLATHPNVQEKLLQELDTARANTEGKSLYDLANHIEYLDDVVSETLRLCSPGFNLIRTCNEDVVIKGIPFPKGADVNIPAYCLHRDPEAWERPDEFYPEHFAPEAKAKRNPYSFMPFGLGPRMCIGNRFALNEIKICLLTVLEKYKFEKCAATKVLEHRSSLIMMPKDTITLKIAKR